MIKTDDIHQLKSFVQTCFPGKIAQIKEELKRQELGIPEASGDDAYTNILEEDEGSESPFLGVFPSTAAKETALFAAFTLGFLFLPYKPIKNRLRNTLGLKRRKVSRYSKLS